MSASRGNFQRTFGLRLSLHFAHVGVMRLDSLRLADKWGYQFSSGEMRRHLQQRLGGIHGGVFHQGGFGSIRLRKDESAAAVYGAIGHCQCAAYCAQFTGQREFAGIFIFSKFVGRDLPSRGEDAECNGQIEAPAFLGQIGGRKIDSDAACGEIELAILQRGTYAVFAFFDFGFRQTHDGEIRQTIGDMHLDGDEGRFHSG